MGNRPLQGGGISRLGRWARCTRLTEVLRIEVDIGVVKQILVNDALVLADGMSAKRCTESTERTTRAVKGLERRTRAERDGTHAQHHRFPPSAAAPISRCRTRRGTLRMFRMGSV